MSGTNAPGFGSERAIETGSRLAGRRVTAAVPARPGGNNRVFRLDMADGSRLALKYYPSDSRDRLGQEYEALSFLSQHGVKLTPQPFASDRGENCALYEWFDGEAAVLRPQPDDVDRLADFLISLQHLHGARGAETLRSASAAIFSPAQALAQCDQRLHRLVEQVTDHVELRAFLQRQFGPSATLARARVEERFAKLELDPAAELAPARRALSPSDFGLHNAMRSEAGKLRFVDFEYFGWDDPVKLMSDTALHPGSNFPEDSANRLIGRLSREFEVRDATFAVRRDVLYPVFGLIWCLIILNDFLPETRSRRDLAGRDAELGAVLARQLDKARRLHQAICQRDPDIAVR
jgi:hypothetical protein